MLGSLLRRSERWVSTSAFAALSRRLLPMLLALSALLVVSPAWAFHTGVSSASWGGFNSPTGCNGCHNAPGGNPGPTLITGPSPIVVAPGATFKYTITVSTNSAGAGINVTAYNTAGGAAAGTLSLCDAVADANCGGLITTSAPAQITHSATHAGAVVSFAFNYTAPASGCYEDELELWVNSVNATGTNAGDHANRFTVLISDRGSACPDDLNPCTLDICDATGACTHPAGNAGTVCRVSAGQCDVAETCTGTSVNCPADGFKPNGTACNDANACTANDQCTNGVCGGALVQCNAPSACHTSVGATCDPVSGACSYPNAVDGTGCDDGNACTVNDVCTAGTCGGSAVVCTSPSACHTASGATCNPATGACVYPNATDGTVCNDGNACTQTDKCQAGVCAGSNPVQCLTPGACKTALGATCNPATGACAYPNAADGTTCNDGNGCTQTDQCEGGTCTGTNPVVCDSPPACRTQTGATCNTATGTCTYPADADGTACDDGDACTQTDTCNGGSCVGSNPVVCPTPAACHDLGVCDTTTGQCTDPLKVDGTGCSDSDACTQTDTCTGGTCNGDNPVVCAPKDQCHDAGTCDATSGTCDNPPKPDGTACDDHDLCTQDDACASGTCKAGPAVACKPVDECHTAGVCNPASGDCSNPKKPNGTTCSKGTCDDGVCTSSGAGPGAGGGGGGSASGAGGGGESSGNTGGCGCRIAGDAEDDGARALGLLLVAAALASRRRRASRS